MTIRVGTRGSALATAQAGMVARDLEAAAGEAVELVVVRTEGDRSSASLATIGGTGVFASALRDALRAGEVDAVVHSLKDLPTAPSAGLVVGAVPGREDARDALCARDGLALADLPAGATVGTGSPRRAAQLGTARPDLHVVDIRGNVDTRLRMVESGELDAVVLSLAGLTRLGREAAATEMLPLDEWPTAPGQGALAVEVRSEDGPQGDSPLAAALRALHVVDAGAAITAERVVLAGLEAGCAAPIGATAAVDGDTIEVRAEVHRPGGGERIVRIRSGALPAEPEQRTAAARAVGAALVGDLLDAGAARLAPLGVDA